MSGEGLAEQRGAEKRLALGWFDPAYLQISPVTAVLSSEGGVTAFANVVSEYRARRSRST